MLEDIIKWSVVIIVALLFLFTGGAKYIQIKEGEDYKNFFKTARAGIGFLFTSNNERLMPFSVLNTIIFGVYFLAFVSAIAFIPMIQMSFTWILTIAIIIALSVSLHFYIRYINKVMFKHIHVEKGNV